MSLPPVVSDPEGTRTRTQRSWGHWNAGEGLWWRNDLGVHGVLCTRPAEYGPKGAHRRRGEITEVSAHNLAALNRTLRRLGFGPTRFRLRDLKTNPDPGLYR